MKGLANRPQKCKKGVQKNVQAPPFIYVRPFGVPDCTLVQWVCINNRH